MSCLQALGNKSKGNSQKSLKIGFRLKNEALNANVRLPDDNSIYGSWYSGDHQEACVSIFFRILQRSATGYRVYHEFVS